MVIPTDDDRAKTNEKRAFQCIQLPTSAEKGRLFRLFFGVLWSVSLTGLSSLGIFGIGV